jgi:hypothetical protein
LNETAVDASVAEYKFTGIETNPKEIVPLDIGLAMVGCREV